VLSALELLQSQRQVTGAELAQRLDVDRRTVRRYIQLLEEMGIPITAERGRDGGYLLVAGFKLPPMMFTDDEALALSVGLLAARGLGLAVGTEAIASAQAKLERVMPTNLKRRVRAADQTMTLDRSAASALRDNAALMALSSAAQRQERVRLRYLAREGETEREFDAYGLVHRHGHWYAVGMCHLRHGLRSFRVDRVQRVWPLEVHFERPEKFDALEHLVRSVATLPRAFTIEVLLETDLETARRSFFPAIGVFESVPEGVLLFAQADDLNWFARELARLPFGFRIHRPARLHAELEGHLRKLMGKSQRGRSHRPLRRRGSRPTARKQILERSAKTSGRTRDRARSR
jgi:predicted DNA-binding transcriptional regulator YafY